MINIKFYVLSSGNIAGFSLSGHSGYAEHGSDIVCAAVSSAAYMTVNTLEEVLKVNSDVEINESTGYMNVMVNESEVLSCRDLLNGFKIHMLFLEEMYPKNIKVNYAEV